MSMATGRAQTTRFLLIFLILAGSAAHAQSVSTDPWGFIPVTAKGSSDTLISAPLHRGAEFQGILTAASGSTLTVNGTSWGTDAFKNTHYVLIASGSKEGAFYQITGNTSTALTINLAGDTLGSAVTSGTEIQVIPFWTLNTLFPEGAGVKPSPTFLPQTSVLIPEQTRVGINLSAAASYFYYSGTQRGGEGWRRFGVSPTLKFDDQPLSPNSVLIVRHEVPGDTTITVPGAVQMTTLANVIATLAANKPQDKAIAFNVAAPTSLGASLLFESGSFTGSQTIDSPVDELLVFDPSVAQTNKPPSAIYYYFLGSTHGGPGWRRKGDLSTKHNTTLLFQPASGYILRKAASPQPASARWSVRPSYVPQ